jgi:hypothetical protein
VASSTAYSASSIAAAAKVDRVRRVGLGVLGLGLGLVAVEVVHLLIDPLTQALHMRVPVVLDLLPAAADLVRGLLGLCVQLGRACVGLLARGVDLGLQLGLVLRGRGLDVGLGLVDLVRELSEAVRQRRHVVLLV